MYYFRDQRSVVNGARRDSGHVYPGVLHLIIVVVVVCFINEFFPIRAIKCRQRYFSNYYYSAAECIWLPLKNLEKKEHANRNSNEKKICKTKIAKPENAWRKRKFPLDLGNCFIKYARFTRIILRGYIHTGTDDDVNCYKNELQKHGEVRGGQVYRHV